MPRYAQLVMGPAGSGKVVLRCNYCTVDWLLSLNLNANTVHVSNFRGSPNSDVIQFTGLSTCWQGCQIYQMTEIRS
jgi:hypothetical protein